MVQHHVHVDAVVQEGVHVDVHVYVHVDAVVHHDVHVYVHCPASRAKLLPLALVSPMVGCYNYLASREIIPSHQQAQIFGFLDTVALDCFVTFEKSVPIIERTIPNKTKIWSICIHFITP